MLTIPYARQQPYDRQRYTATMADLLLRRGDALAAAARARGDASSAAWLRAGDIVAGTMAQVGNLRDEERNIAAIQHQRDIENAQREREFDERVNARKSDEEWRRQQFRAQTAGQAADDIEPGVDVPEEVYNERFAGTPAAMRFRHQAPVAAQPAWEQPAVDDSMGDAGPAEAAQPGRYTRTPNAQESLAMANLALGKEDRAYRTAQDTIQQGQHLDDQRRAQSNADRAYNRGVHEFDVTNARLRDKDNAEQTSIAGFNFGVSGDEFLKSLPPHQQRLVKSVAEYKTDIKQVSSLRGDQRQKLAMMVLQYDPTFDMTQDQSRAALAKDFRTGKAANNIRSLNTAIGHLDSFEKASTALNNTSWQIINRSKNWLNEQTGDPNIVLVQEKANAVETELATVFKGMGATDQEIKEWRRNFSAAQSPAQFKAIVGGAIELMGSRLDAMRYQYENGMGKPKDFEILSDTSRKILTRLGVDPDMLEPPLATPAEAEQGDWFDSVIQRQQRFPDTSPGVPRGTSPAPLFGPRPQRY